MKVLVPVEDPLFGAAVVDFIGRHKWPLKTEFLVAHVIDPTLLDHSTQVSFISLLRACDEQVIADATGLVNAVAQALNNCCPYATVAQEVVQAPVKDQIIRMAEKWGADLVIAGSHGRSGFNEFVLGSVSLALTQEIQAPLVLVRPDKESLRLWVNLDYSTRLHQSIEKELARLQGKRKEERVLLAMDETPLSRDIIDFVSHHGWPCDTEFKLISAVQAHHVTLLSEHKKTKLMQQMVWDREGILSVLASRLREDLSTTKVSTFVEHGKPKEIILSIARDWQADLLVLGCHFRTSVQRFFLGSTALPILCSAPCTVLLFKDKSKARALYLVENQAVMSLN